MNSHYLEGESYSKYKERLEREMTAEHPEDLDRDCFSDDWKIDGNEVKLRSDIVRESGYPHKPTGTVRFVIGPYGHQRRSAWTAGTST